MTQTDRPIRPTDGTASRIRSCARLPFGLAALAILIGSIGGVTIPASPSLSQDQIQQGLDAVPRARLRKAIDRCIQQRGATGSDIGEILFDPVTGEIKYRCDGDEDGEFRPFVEQNAPPASAGEGQAGTAGTTTGATTGTGPEVPPPRPRPTDDPGAGSEPDNANIATQPRDFGAEAAYVNRPSTPPPTRPEDCVGIHPYYQSFPACVVARRMGLLDPPSSDPDDLPPAFIPAQQSEGGTSEAQTQPQPQFQPPESPTAAQAIPQGPTTLPRNAAEQAARDRQAARAAQIAAEQAAEPVGEVAPEPDTPIDWIGMALWAGYGLLGLLGLGAFAVFLITLFNRMRMNKRELENPADPYAAYFDRDPAFGPADGEAGGKDDEEDDPGGLAMSMGPGSELSKFIEEDGEGGFDPDLDAEETQPLFGHLDIPEDDSGSGGKAMGGADDDISRALEAALDEKVP